jgi:hypothetical protein
MEIFNLMYEDMNELINDYNLSNESIYVVDQFLRMLAANHVVSNGLSCAVCLFLHDITIEFESQALSRLKRYAREQDAWRKEMIALTKNPPF